MNLLNWCSEEALVERERMVFECETKDCVYNDCGICCFSLVHGRISILNEEDGCCEYTPQRKVPFDALRKAFEEHRPRGPIVGETPWFNIKWKNGSDSVNDLLVGVLRENGFTYLCDFSGVVWFLYHDVWERCTYEVKDGWVHFYMCKFDD